MRKPRSAGSGAPVALMATRGRRLLHAALAALVLAGCGDSPGGPVAADPPNLLPSPSFPECRPVEPYTPTGEWRYTCPTDAGFDSTRLREAVDAWAAFPKVHGVLVARHGYVVLEAYHSGYDSRFRFYQQSATKSVTSALVGIAIGRGELAGRSAILRDLIPTYLRPSDDPAVATITLDQLLTMSSGFDGPPVGPRPLVRSLLARPVVHEPGTFFAYDDGGFHVLAVALQTVTGSNLRDHANQHLFAPLGFTVGSGEWATDDLGIPYGSTGLRLSLREMAKVGELYLRDGVWDGVPVLPAGWVASTRAAVALPNLPQEGLSYGLGWWLVNYAGHDAFFAAGHGGQTITVVPDADLVVAITADPRDDGAWQRYRTVIGEHLLPALLPERAGVGR